MAVINITAECKLLRKCLDIQEILKNIEISVKSRETAIDHEVILELDHYLSCLDIALELDKKHRANLKDLDYFVSQEEFFAYIDDLWGKGIECFRPSVKARLRRILSSADKTLSLLKAFTTQQSISNHYHKKGE